MLAIVHALVLALQPAPTSAPPLASATSIDWRAPVGCPTREQVESSVVELTGRIPEAEELRVSAHVEHTSVDWQVELATQSGSATHVRVLHAQSCAGLASATALIIAVILDPVTAASKIPQPEPEPEPQTEPQTGTSFTPAPPEPSRPTPATVVDLRPWNIGFGLGLGGEVGAIPGGTGGARVELFAQRGLFEIRLTGTYWLRRETTGEPGVQVQLGTAAVTPCVVPSVGPVQFPVCAGLEVGGLRGRGVGVLNPRSATVLWLAATVGPGLRWWLRPRFALFATAEAFAPIVRSRLTLDSEGGEALHEPSAVGFRGLLGISARFSVGR